jgi:hypothetical protein
MQVSLLRGDVTFALRDVDVRFDADGGRRLLQVDCYVMWTEACAG